MPQNDGKTHANCLHFSISRSRWRFSYSKFWRFRWDWSISCLASAVFSFASLVAVFEARWRDFRRPSNAMARMWRAAESCWKWEGETSSRSLSRTSSEEGVMGVSGSCMWTSSRPGSRVWLQVDKIGRCLFRPSHPHSHGSSSSCNVRYHSLYGNPP